MPQRNVATRARLRRIAGITLIEMQIALALSAVICVAIVTMFFAIVHGSEESGDLYFSVTKNRSLSSRLGAAIRSSALILDASGERLILWTGDEDEDGQPSLAELKRIERDADSDELVCYTPAASAPATVYELAENFGAVTDAAIASGAMVPTVWATGIESWAVRLNDDEAQSARRVSMRIEHASQRRADPGIATVSLRN